MRSSGPPGVSALPRDTMKAQAEEQQSNGGPEGAVGERPWDEPACLIVGTWLPPRRSCTGWGTIGDYWRHCQGSTELFRQFQAFSLEFL